MCGMAACLPLPCGDAAALADSRSDVLPTSCVKKHVCGPFCSRNSEDNTKKYPDIAASVPRLLKPGVRSVVLDCEAVAFDREEGKILPFQARH